MRAPKDAGSKRCMHQKDAFTKEMHAIKDACAEEMHAPKRCPRRCKCKKMPASTHVHEDARGASSKDTRVGLPLRASKRCPRRPRHTRVGLFACVQGMP